MTSQQCCKNCKHCITGQAALLYFCRLRKVKIHSEISACAFCHHWTKQEPSLPDINEQFNHKTGGKQLDFDKVLVVNDK